MCRIVVEELNAKRMLVPDILAELSQQLLNLNVFLAESTVQTDCAQTFAKFALDQGNFTGELTKIDWEVEDNLDDDEGWSWIRNLRHNVKTFDIEMSEDSGVSSTDSASSVLGEKIEAGNLAIGSVFGSANAKVGEGSFLFETEDCNLESCKITFHDFQFSAEGFEVGPFEFSDVSVSLTEPAEGLASDEKIVVPLGRMLLSSQFRLGINGFPVLGGALLSTTISNSEPALARLADGPLFGVEFVHAEHWPFSFSLETELSPCD